jgi:Flp pilus assembly protein TadG
MRLMSAFAICCRRARQRMRSHGTKGSAAIEFAMVAPILFLFIFGIIETGVIFFAASMLQNATDDTARKIRTGELSGTLTAAQIASSVCSEVHGLINNCAGTLQVDMRTYTSFGSASYPTVTNANGVVDPSKLQLQSASDCSIILLRTFYAWTIMTPLMRPLLESTTTGQTLLTSSAAFRTEPYTSSSTC